jgi:hypothetical protein
MSLKYSGGAVLSPADVATGGRRRGMTQKVKKMLKMMKLMKKRGGVVEGEGEEVAVPETPAPAPAPAAGRRRGSRKTRRGRKSRRGFFA